MIEVSNDLLSPDVLRKIKNLNEETKAFFINTHRQIKSCWQWV